MFGPDRSLLILIPAYNEEEALAVTVLSVRRVFPEVPILVVDDGSVDSTARIARDAKVELLRLPHHLGLGGAVQVGYRFAFEHGFERVVRVDADGQHIPTEIPKLLEKMSDGDYDMVTGSRFLEPNGYQIQILRRFGGMVFSLILIPFLGTRLSDPTSGFIAVNRKALEVFSRSFPLEYPEIEALVVLKRKAMRFCEVPAKMRRRQGGRSTIGTWTSISYMMHVLLGVFVNVIKYESRYHTGNRGRS